MGIFSFNEFIVERLGASEASLLFVDTLEARAVGIFESFIKSREKQKKITEVVEYRILRPLINRSELELYSKFPVIKFELEIDFKILSDKEWSKKYPDYGQNLATGGMASYFGNKNWSGYSRIVDPIKQVSEHGIVVNLGITIDVNKSFDLNSAEDIELLYDDVASTLYHELNHCYENYVRTTKFTNIVRPESRSFDTVLSFTGENIWKFPKQVWNFWNKFNYYLYVSEYHETRANVQEIFYFIKEYPEKDLNEFKIYRIADEMEKFDHKIFYENLLKRISTHEPYIGGEENVAERLKEMWIRTYEKECKNQNTKPIISFKTLRNMNCLEFFKYWQKRINYAGQRIKRKAHNIKASL